MNDVVRSEFETREELAIWRRLALKEKYARETEADRILREEYEHMLECIEQDHTAMSVPEDQYSQSPSKSQPSRCCCLKPAFYFNSTG